MLRKNTTRPKFHIACLAVIVAFGAAVGCSNGASDPAGAADPSASSGEAKPAERRSKSTEDRGNAQFNMAGSTWKGERATARLKGDRLKISASHTTRDGDKMKRDSLGLNISGFNGPGSYTADMVSMFVRVSITIPKEEGDAEAGASKMLFDAIGDSSNIRLANAKVEVTSVSDGYVDGRFSLEMPGMPDKSVTEGQFHARLRE
ncbi:hypothetical protein [Dokdonella sp.]|uniref:hypothetical protein n=1 Tax=Dokdonella sp. TaxID=2291710 RepID=UPI003C54E3CB